MIFKISLRELLIFLKSEVSRIANKVFEDTFIISIDVSKNFSEAILTIFPETKNQRFIL